MRKLALFLLLAVALPSTNFAQLVCGLGEYQEKHLIGCEHGLQGTGVDEFKFVPPPANFEPNGPRDAVISVVYNGFSTDAQAAFQYAVDVWASQLTSSVPILINATWAPIGGNTLGFAGADGYFRNFPGAPEPNTFYPAALANKLRGSDNDITSFDLSCTFNSNTNWYLGTDGNTPGGQYDFVTVVLHELCHGLGFIGSANVSGAQGFLGLAGDPIIYDTFVEELDGTDVVTLANGSTALGDALTSNQLYWNGPEGIGANAGNRPRLYAPGTFSGGSSFSHLNEGTYGAGTINGLMTPFLGTAEAIHNPGPIVLGIFTDIGWTVGGCEISNVTIGTQGACLPATNGYSQQLTIEYSGEPATGLLLVNGSLFTITGSPQTITLQNQPSDGQPVDLNISFSQDSECTFTLPNAWTAPEPCCENIRLTSVDPDLFRIGITNYGSCTADISDKVLSSQGNNVLISSLLVVSGSTNVAPGATVELQWGGWNPNAAGSEMALYVSGPNVFDPNDMIDYMQYGNNGNSRESVAVAKGIWGAGDFVPNIAPYTYIGDGDQTGVAFWEGAVPPCSFDVVTAGAQTACDPNTNTYTQEVTLNYISEPTTGDLNVGGQIFPITGSPQTVTLTGLNSDGAPVNLVYFFTDNTGCIDATSNLFVAPAECACPGDFDGSGTITIADFLLLLADFGCTGTCTTDLDNDGMVTSSDLLLFTSVFDSVCP